MFQVIDVSEKPAQNYSNYLVTINSQQVSDGGRRDKMFRQIIRDKQARFHEYIVPIGEAVGKDFAMNSTRAKIVTGFEISPKGKLYHVHMCIEMHQMRGLYQIDIKKLRNDIIDEWGYNIHLDIKPIKTSIINIYNYIRKNQPNQNN